MHRVWIARACHRPLVDQPVQLVENGLIGTPARPPNIFPEMFQLGSAGNGVNMLSPREDPRQRQLGWRYPLSGGDEIEAFRQREIYGPVLGTEARMTAADIVLAERGWIAHAVGEDATPKR